MENLIKQPPLKTLADRQRFVLDREHWKALMAALDAPPRHHTRMERLLNEPSIFDVSV
jgi:uncharacterized protein (DUF1778 family)